MTVCCDICRGRMEYYAAIARECMVEVSTVYQWFKKGRVPGPMSQKILADKFWIIYENQAKELDKP